MDLERNAPRDTAGEVKDPTAGSVRSTVTKSPFERVSKAVRTNCAAGIGARSSVSDASKMRASGVAIRARGLGRKWLPGDLLRDDVARRDPARSYRHPASRAAAPK
jgi:hypothetical protein